MGRIRTFLGAGAAFVVLGGWALGFWWASNLNWMALGRVGGVLVGIGILLVSAGLFFRWNEWE